MNIGFDFDRFCTTKDVYDLVLKSTDGKTDPLYFNSVIEMFRKMIESSNKYTLIGDSMDLSSFLALTKLLKDWYKIHLCDIAEFIDQRYREKYAISKSDILNVISQAMSIKGSKEPEVEFLKEQVVKKETRPTDMYKAVQSALKSGMTKAAVQKKYNLSQRELVLYEGHKYWSDSQKEDHKAMLEYRRLHPDCSNNEAIVQGCGKDAVAYRFALVPTKEQQDAYNKKFSEKPKAVIKGTDVKSLILSDKEAEEQQELYSKIKEIASARNVSARDVTSLLKSKLVRDYGIVIEQIKKDLMIKYRVNRGEGKAPNALEAIVMSEYLPIAKSILDDMLTESFAIK